MSNKTLAIFLLLGVLALTGAFYFGRRGAINGYKTTTILREPSEHNDASERHFDAKLRNLEAKMHYHLSKIQKSLDDTKEIRQKDAIEDIDTTLSRDSSDGLNPDKAVSIGIRKEEDELLLANEWIESSILSYGRDYSMESDVTRSFTHSDLQDGSYITDVVCAESKGCKISFDHSSEDAASRIRGASHRIFPWAYAGYIDAAGERKTDIVLFLEADDFNATLR